MVAKLDKRVINWVPQTTFGHKCHDNFVVWVSVRNGAPLLGPIQLYSACNAQKGPIKPLHPLTPTSTLKSPPNTHTNSTATSSLCATWMMWKRMRLWLTRIGFVKSLMQKSRVLNRRWEWLLDFTSTDLSGLRSSPLVRQQGQWSRSSQLDEYQLPFACVAQAFHWECWGIPRRRSEGNGTCSCTASPHNVSEQTFTGKWLVFRRNGASPPGWGA